MFQESAMPLTLRRRAVRRALGQGMTEYIVLVALVAIATIGVVGLFGNDLRALFGMSGDAIAGDSDVAMRAGASNADVEQKRMQNFAQNNSGVAGGGGPMHPN
jgi:Flp pilus assembly pilin Flp